MDYTTINSAFWIWKLIPTSEKETTGVIGHTTVDVHEIMVKGINRT